MCYICEARGTVGVGYKATQKEIAAALRLYPKGACRDRNCCTWTCDFRPLRADLTRAPPAGKRLWSNADLKEYGKEWRREHD